jgi:hypothetical protein
MNNMRTMSTNGTTINMSDIEVVSDSGTMSEGERFGENKALVRGKASRVGPKLTNSPNDMSMKGSVTVAKPVCGTIFRMVFLPR